MLAALGATLLALRSLPYAALFSGWATVRLAADVRCA